MDPSTSLARDVAPPSPPTEPPAAALASVPAPRGPSPLVRRIRVAGAVLALLALLVVGYERLTAAPVVCESCHEMGVRASAWRVSPHANVDCVACHVTPRPWYQMPQTLYDRSRLLGRDVVKHFSGAPSVVDTRPPHTGPMSDAVCMRCHDPNRKPTAGLGILIDHPKHAKRNGSCVSCHITVAHPKPSRGTALSFMGQCFTCHGVEAGAKAPATCTMCHPADFKMKPASHDSAKWARGHGRIELSDPSQCGMCHKQAFCDTCHGLKMPHPKDWARRTGHPVYAKRDRQVCVKCHEDKRDWCGMCHHKAYDPSKGTWVKQHFIEVTNKGASYCLEECHSPVFCSRCHVQGIASGGGDGSSGS